MARVDTEVLFYDLKSYLQANIAAKVAEINSEKNDGLLMAAPPSNDAYLDLSLDQKVPNYNPFVFIHIDSQRTTSQGMNASKEIRFEVAYFVAKTGKPAEIRLGLRYTRMLEEVAKGAWRNIMPGYTFDMEALDPVDAQLPSSDKWHKVYSVALTVTLAN